MIDRLAEWWGVQESRLAMLFASAALGRMLWVSHQVREGKRRWQVSLLIYEGMMVAAVWILSLAAISVARRFDVEFDLPMALGLALLLGWVGLHGLQYFVVRAMVRRGVLADEAKTQKPNIGA